MKTGKKESITLAEKFIEIYMSSAIPDFKKNTKNLSFSLYILSLGVYIILHSISYSLIGSL